MKLGYLLGAALAVLSSSAALAAAAPIKGVKNVIIVINDGAGYTVYDATRLYLGAPLVTDGAAFKKTSVSTYPLRIDTVLPGSTVQDPTLVYTSARFWDTTPVAGNSTISGYTAYPAGFQGYEWSRLAHPDSGNTASSIANGIKSYNNAINVDGAGNPQTTLTDIIDIAATRGKMTGVVSTVQFGDATPSALGGAHNITRGNREQITNEMFSSGKLDVIGGTANPDFDNNAQPRAPVYAPVGYFGPVLWNDLKNNTNLSALNGQSWKLLQTKASIDALATGQVKPPKKLAMILKADTSSNFNRTLVGAPTAYVPFTQPFNTDVPTLKNLTLAALNTVGQSGRGFYLMTEAGAVDRAEHGNNTGRMIEEQIESNTTVQAIIDWVNRTDTAATWNDTLLIVTADHDHLLYGPDGATVPFQPLVDNGPGVVPGNRWFGPNHGTGLVPLYAYGKGAAQIVAAATKTDAYTDAQGRKFGYGKYLDQTELGEILKATVAQ